MGVLLSIRPEYVRKIFSGEKKFEFRKKVSKSFNSESIFIYSSAPVQKIVGQIHVDTIITDTPENLWHACKEHAGIDETKFFEYFDGKEHGYAIKIKSVSSFQPAIKPKTILPNFSPPQSFYYVQDKMVLGTMEQKQSSPRRPR